MKRIGLREANQQFSKMIKAIKAGEEVILTERGKQIAVIKPLQRAEKLEMVIRRMEVAGLLRAAFKSSPLPSWTPRPIRGAPLSFTLREDRDGS